MGIPLFRSDSTSSSVSQSRNTEISIPEFNDHPASSAPRQYREEISTYFPGSASRRNDGETSPPQPVNHMAESSRVFRRRQSRQNARRPDFIDAESMVDARDIEERQRATGAWANGDWEAMRESESPPPLSGGGVSMMDSEEGWEADSPDDIIQQLNFAWELIQVLEANFTSREARLQQETEALRRELIQKNTWIRVTARAINEHSRFCSSVLQQQQQQQQCLAQAEVEDPNIEIANIQIETQRPQLSMEETNELTNESREQNTQPQDPETGL